MAKKPFKNPPPESGSDRAPTNWTELVITAIWSSRWRKAYLGLGIIFGALYAVWTSLPDSAKERMFAGLGWGSSSEKRVRDNDERVEAGFPRVDTADAQRYRKSAITTLSRFLMVTQSDGGGFGWVLADPQSPPDPWTTAQCVAALVSATGRLRSLEQAYRYLESSKEGLGWPREAREKTSTSVTSWVGIAFLHGLSIPGSALTERTRQRALEDLRQVSAGLISQQKGDGSWSDYYSAGRSIPAAEHATYLTLTFLLNLKGANLPSLDSVPLNRSIQGGLNWILNEYDPSSGGWKDRDNVGVEPDMATLFLLVLLEANRSGFTYVENSLAFHRARSQWLRQAKEDATARSVRAYEDLRQPQGHLGYAPVHIVWYPWSLLLSTLLATAPSTPGAERVVASHVAARLWVRLPSALDSITVAKLPSYPVAETLYALGLMRDDGAEVGR